MKDSTLSVTVQVKNMTKVHSKVMHGIRSSFMANKLQAIEYVRSTNNYKLTTYTDEHGIAAYKFYLRDTADVGKLQLRDGKLQFPDESTSARAPFAVVTCLPADS